MNPSISGEPRKSIPEFFFATSIYSFFGFAFMEVFLAGSSEEDVAAAMMNIIMVAS